METKKTINSVWSEILSNAESGSNDVRIQSKALTGMLTSAQVDTFYDNKLAEYKIDLVSKLNDFEIVLVNELKTNELRTNEFNIKKFNQEELFGDLKEKIQALTR